jgi:hypothetical protein
MQPGSRWTFMPRRGVQNRSRLPRGTSCVFATMFVLLLAAASACGATPGTSTRNASSGLTGGCTVTIPNGSTVPGQIGSSPGQIASRDSVYGNGKLSVALQPNGRIVAKPDPLLHDGSISMKFMWWRGVNGNLQITGRRLDAPAPPARGDVPGGYGDTGFQVSGIIFPTPGCWEVTGSVSLISLTFVTEVAAASLS